MEYVYLDNTHTIFSENGELHLISDDKTVVINCENFYNDLPYIVELIMKARQETTELIEEQLIQIITTKTKTL